MAKYLDVYVMPIPKRNVTKYKKLARLSGKVWKEHGALAYMEGSADDVPEGKITSLPKSVKLKKGEEVWVGIAIYKSRRHRDQVLKKVMADKRLEFMMNPKAIPFDGKRMIFGGFKSQIDL